MEVQKIKHSRLYEKVIASMEELYKQGHLKIGDTLLSERELAQQFGVSRGTLRDAFRILESQGIIETRPGGGRYLRRDFNLNKSESIIHDLQKAAMFELLEAREIFEVGMIDLICKRATEEDIQKLEDIVHKQAGIDTFESKNLDFYFHHALAECTKNKALVNFIKLNLELINQIRKNNFLDKKRFTDSQKEHMAIVNSLKTRDVNLVKIAIIDHFKNIRKRLQE